MPSSNHRQLFFKYYANLPISVRREVVLSIREDEVGPVTWEVAYREISHKTKLGDIILEKLITMQFIPNRL